jgi:hypothetical protein
MQNFLPVKAHIKEHPAWFHRFDALWTPTVLILDSSGVERSRIEGYLPNSEFRAALESGSARVAFMHKQFADAERRYGDIVQRYPGTAAAPEAVYWTAVSHYKATNDHTVLGTAAEQLKNKYPGSIWAQKASPWRTDAAGDSARGSFDVRATGARRGALGAVEVHGWGVGGLSKSRRERSDDQVRGCERRQARLVLHLHRGQGASNHAVTPEDSSLSFFF